MSTKCLRERPWNDGGWQLSSNDTRTAANQGFQPCRRAAPAGNSNSTGSLSRFHLSTRRQRDYPQRTACEVSISGVGSARASQRLDPSFLGRWLIGRERAASTGETAVWRGEVWRGEVWRGEVWRGEVPGLPSFGSVVGDTQPLRPAW
jgi:hypothetical protein